MNFSLWIRIIMIVFAAGLFFVNVIQYAKHRITEMTSLWWCFFSLILILFSVIPALSGWSSVLNSTLDITLYLLFMIAVCWSYLLSARLSRLERKNQELAMHVSLLNQENESILAQVKQLRESMNLKKIETEAIDEAACGQETEYGEVHEITKVKAHS